MTKAMCGIAFVLLSAQTVWSAPELSSKEFSTLKSRLSQAAKAGQWKAAASVVPQLARDDSKRAVDLLLTWVSRHPLSEVYEPTLEGLAGMDSEEAVARICEKLASGKVSERLILIDACGRRSDARTGKALAETLTARKPPVQRAAVEAVRKRKLVAGVDGLIDLLAKLEESKDREGLTMTLVRRALEDITGQRRDRAQDYRLWWEKNREGFRPPRTEVKKSNKTPKSFARPRFFGVEIVSNRIVFVIDISGSMQRTDPLNESGGSRPGTGGGPAPKVSGSRVRIDRAKFQLVQVVKALPERAKFTIVAYSGHLLSVPGKGYQLPEGTPKKGSLPPRIGNFQWLYMWKKRLAPANARNKQSAVKFVKSLKADGSTFTLRALRLALKVAKADTIILLSDGAPTEIPGVQARRLKSAKEIQDEISALNRFKRIRIDTFGVGRDDFGTFDQFLQDLAKENGGTHTEVR